MRWTILIAAAVLALFLCALAGRSERQVDAGTALRLDIQGLLDRADLALEGRVLSERVLYTSEGRIETEYELELARSFWGDPAPRQRVRLPGGVLPNGSGLVIPGMPGLSVGEDLVLFLSRPGSSGVRVPVGLTQGKLNVIDSLSGETRLVQAHGGACFADPTQGRVHAPDGLTVFDYADTLAEIYAAADARRARGGAPLQGVGR